VVNQRPADSGRHRTGHRAKTVNQEPGGQRQRLTTQESAPDDGQFEASIERVVSQDSETKARQLKAGVDWRTASTPGPGRNR